MSNNGLCPKLMAQDVSAPELLIALVCQCNDSCVSNCTCKEHSQPCTIVCRCEAATEGQVDDTLTYSNIFAIQSNSSDDDDDVDVDSNYTVMLHCKKNQ